MHSVQVCIYYYYITLYINRFHLGNNNTCSMQFWTDSGGGWYACSTIDIVCKGCTGGVPVSRDQCVIANNLNFCSSKDGSNVYVPTGENATEIDGLASHVYSNNINNPSIFTNGNSSDCITAYKEMMCELYLAPCASSTSSYTQSQCQQALTTCGITEAQSNLYNCSIFSTSTSTPTSTSTSSSSILLLNFIYFLCTFLFLFVLF